LSTHVCRLPGSISGSCSASLEPNPDSKIYRTLSSARLRWDRRGNLATTSASLRYWNSARQRYCRQLVRYRKTLASLPTRSPSQQPRPARKAGFLDLRKQLRERDRLSAGGRWIRTFSTAANESPRFPKHPGTIAAQMDPTLEQMAGSLVESGNYRVTCRVEAQAEYHPPDNGPKLVAAVVDVETTGTNPDSQRPSERSATHCSGVPRRSPQLQHRCSKENRCGAATEAYRSAPPQLWTVSLYRSDGSNRSNLVYTC
jgi:hypothetical protein